MNTNTQHTKRYARYIPHISLIVFALITLYFCISYYRLSKIKPSDLNELTSSVESVWLKKAKGKQGKPEVWISMGQSGKYRVVHANNSILQELSQQIKTNDVITIYLKKAQVAFLDLGNDNDILQIARNGQVIYSLDIPQKDFLNSTLFSAIMSLFLPLAFMIYWFKSKNNLIEALRAAGTQKLNVSH